MDDQISRKEAENTLRQLLMETAINCADAGDPLDEFYVDIAHNRLETWISLIPAAPVSVPLDKLCRMLAKYIGFPCNYSPIDEEMADYCGDQCVMDDIGCWEKVLSKWMEG